MRQAANLEHLLCKSKFMPVEENFHVIFCGKNCAWCPYLLKASSYLFKRIRFSFSKKKKINFGNIQEPYLCLIYLFYFCQACKKECIGETGRLVKRISFYKQHIRQPQYQQIKVEEHLRLCSCGDFQMFPFLQIK